MQARESGKAEDSITGQSGTVTPISDTRLWIQPRFLLLDQQPRITDDLDEEHMSLTIHG